MSRPAYLKARYHLTLPGRGKVFVKVMHAAGSRPRAKAVSQAARERQSLRLLKGLAVPRLVPVPEGTVRRLLGFKPAACLGQASVRGKSMRVARINAAQCVGVWLFLVEQLAAFRKRGVLYTDLKPSNVLVSERPLKAVQIDFNFATAVRPRGSYPAHRFGYTSGYEAPEHGRSTRLTERTVVYQLGMLLASSLMGYDNEDMDGAGGRDKLRGLLSRLGSPGLGRLVAACLSRKPEARPKSYAEVLERVNGMRCAGISAKALAVWDRLRAPYVKVLEKTY